MIWVLVFSLAARLEYSSISCCGEDVYKRQEQAIQSYNRDLHMEQNFDLLSREFMIGSQKSCLYFIDGDGYGQVTTQIMRAFMD